MSGFGKRAVCGLLGGDNGRLAPVQCVQGLLVGRSQPLHQFVEIMKRTGVLQVLAASERPRVERFNQVLLDFVEMHRFQTRGSRGNRREELCVQRTPGEKTVHACATRICGQPLPSSSLHARGFGAAARLTPRALGFQAIRALWRFFPSRARGRGRMRLAACTRRDSSRAG